MIIANVSIIVSITSPLVSMSRAQSLGMSATSARYNAWTIS